MTLRAPDGNFFSGDKAPSSGELFHDILRSGNVIVERIISSSDIPHNDYCQRQDEWVIVLKGNASITIGERECTMREGDYVFIPAGVRHRVLSVENGTLWLAVHIFKDPL